MEQAFWLPFLKYLDELERNLGHEETLDGKRRSIGTTSAGLFPASTAAIVALVNVGGLVERIAVGANVPRRNAIGDSMAE